LLVGGAWSKKVLFVACLFACGRAGAPEVAESNSLRSTSPASAPTNPAPNVDPSAPALPILAAADVSAPPAVPSDCPASAAQAPAVHRPGPCTVIKGWTTAESWRTQYSWTSGNVVAQSDEHWIGNNLVCEKNSAGAGRSYVRTYDYSCF
jgi:hypothetical protein